MYSQLQESVLHLIDNANKNESFPNLNKILIFSTALTL